MVLKYLSSLGSWPARSVMLAYCFSYIIIFKRISCVSMVMILVAMVTALSTGAEAHRVQWGFISEQKRGFCWNNTSWSRSSFIAKLSIKTNQPWNQIICFQPCFYRQETFMLLCPALQPDVISRHWWVQQEFHWNRLKRSCLQKWLDLL